MRTFGLVAPIAVFMTLLVGPGNADPIVAWGVEPRSQLTTWVEENGSRVLRLLFLPHSTPEELAEAYEILTGNEDHPDRMHPEREMSSAISPETSRS